MRKQVRKIEKVKKGMDDKENVNWSMQKKVIVGKICECVCVCVHALAREREREREREIK